MNLIFKLLENDLIKSKQFNSIPLFVEVPCKKEFLPCVVSASRPDKFLEVSRLTAEDKIRTGVFKYDSANLDLILGPLFQLAYHVCKTKQHGNIFNDVKSATNYIRKQSGIQTMPQNVLYPQSMLEADLEKLSVKLDAYSTHSKIKWNPANVSVITVLSRPDFVGLVQGLGHGHYSVLLHNLQLGIAFVEPM